jgi:hypothetical protein
MTDNGLARELDLIQRLAHAEAQRDTLRAALDGLVGAAMAYLACDGSGIRAPEPWTAHYDALEMGRALPVLRAALDGYGAVVHAARHVDGLWWPQDDNWDGTDLTFWGPEAGEALRDLRTAVSALDALATAKEAGR